MGSLRFALVESGLRSFRHGLNALSKIGSEILIEALHSQLILRSINSSQSAYISISFHSRFFDAYDLSDCEILQAGASLRGIMAVFKTQRIRHFVFFLDKAENILEITLSCENGLKKTFIMGSVTSEILHATVDKSTFPVTLVAETSAFSRLLSTFHSGVEEVTLVSHPESAQVDACVQIESFVDPRKGQHENELITRISVDAQRAFLQYGNTSAYDTSITFNVKDFRVMVSLCENLKACALIRFDGPGQPLVVEPCSNNEGHWDGDFEAEMVLATLMADSGQASVSESLQPAPLTRNDDGAVGTPPEERGLWSTGIPGVLTLDRD